MNILIGANVRFLKNEQLLGCVKETLSYGANTFMFYTGPTQSTLRFDIDDTLSYKAYKLMIDNNINSNDVIVHAPYIINLGNKSDIDKHKFYIDFLVKELERVRLLGFNKLVLHPGNAINISKEEAINNISNAINIAFESEKDTMILLEYMAGKGNEVGSSINDLKLIMKNIKDKNRIGVVLDTCHMNDSGIDLKQFESFLDEFDKEIGINKIKCMHINDSKNEISSHKDRHENIGYGTIGFDTLLNIVYNKRLEGIPMILETPYINRNSKEEVSPYKYEIDNFKNKKFTSFK